MPARLTRSFATRVAMISRRSGCRSSCSRNRSRSSSSRRKLARKGGIVGKARTRAAPVTRPWCASRIANSGAVSPPPRAARSSNVSMLGRNSSSRLRTPACSKCVRTARARRHRRRLGRGVRQRLRLVVVVAQHERRHLVGHLHEQLVPLLLGQVAVGDDRVEDLDVDLVVGAIDARRVVDRVHEDAAPAERVGDPCALREAEVAPSPATRARRSSASARTASFARSPTSAFRSSRAFT